MVEYTALVPETANQQAAVATQIDEAYKSGYYDAQGGRKASQNIDAKILALLMECPLPEQDSDFQSYLIMLRTVLAIIPRIPNYDLSFYREITRDFEDIIDQAESEGMESVVAIDMQKMILRLRAIAPAGGQFEMKGITPVSSIITTRHQNESIVKMPPPAAPPQGGGLFGFADPRNWFRK